MSFYLNHLIRNEKGQSQILMAAGIGIAMTTGAMYLLQYVQQTQRSQLRSNFRSEMRSALDTALKQAAVWYRDEASCDPEIFHQKLYYSAAGRTGLQSTRPASGVTRRGMTVVVNGRPYWVQFGRVARVGGHPESTEVTLDAWTTHLGMRVDQKAVFLDVCSWPCAYTDGETGGPCLATDPLRKDQFHQVTAPQSFPKDATGNVDPTSWDSQGSHQCSAPNRLGFLTGSGKIDVSSLLVLRNYLRSGDLTSAVPLSPPSSSFDPRSCADFDGDGLVNEVDLAILEKYLRGYIYSLPTHY
jgi:hypothetical protein